MRTNSKIQIICTLGPACSRPETIYKMWQAGMRVARINFSHGTHADHAALISTVRQVNREHKISIKILQDLAGYRIRLGELKRPMVLIKYQTVWMTYGTMQTDECIPLQFDDDLNALKKGMDVYIDDGKIYMKVVGYEGKRLKLEVFQGGVLKSRKGVNIPSLILKNNILTQKDREDIAFGLQHKFDYVAQSFVRNRNDVIRIKKIIKPVYPQCQIVAKIENRQGVRNLITIAEESDGIMVARGDLGVSLPVYQIPIIQKRIITQCRRMKKYVITATQMLDSMTEVVRPTRAEVSDVANAILDGTDYVMLSGETAVGNFPVKTVRMMQSIIRYTEQYRHTISK